MNGLARRSLGGAAFLCSWQTRPGNGSDSKPGLATGNALGDVASVRDCREGNRGREQADARLTDPMPGKGAGANFALLCAVDCVKRQPFLTWKGGRVV